VWRCFAVSVISDLPVSSTLSCTAAQRSASSLLFSQLCALSALTSLYLSSFSLMYTGLAYGDQSRELADALWRDRTFQPLDHFSADEAGRQSHQAYISCLLRWGYIRWNPHTRRAGQSKLQWAEEAEHRSAPLDDDSVAALFYGTATR
jgi:hypothetical protein